MPSATRSPRQTVEQLLRAAVGPAPGDMADCYAPEVVIEMPFAVDALYPPRTVTHARSSAPGSRQERRSGGTRPWTTSRSMRPLTQQSSSPSTSSTAR